VDAEGCALQDADSSVRQGRDALSVQVVGEDGGNVLRDAVAVKRLAGHEVAL
jgi:hypothetical protein